MVGRSQPAQPIDKFGDGGQVDHGGVEFIGNFIRKLSDWFLCCDSEGSTIDQITRHAVQAQEAEGSHRRLASTISAEC
jgi:hypothetical protein